MHVAFLAPLPPPRTGQSLCDEAVAEHLRGVHRVQVIATSKGELRQGAGSIRHLPATLRQVGRILAAAVASRRSGADVFYHSPSQTTIGHLKDLLVLAVLGGRRHRVVLHLHGGGFGPVLRGRLAALSSRLFGEVGAAIVLGPSMAGQLEGIVAADRIRTIANFAEDDLFVDPAGIAERWNGDRVRVLLIGSLFRSKGWPAVVEAAGRFAASGSERFEFVIAGGSPHEEELAEVTAAAERLANLEYVGELAGAARAEELARAAVVVVPTRYPWEGQPLVILEAYASGAVVVATDHAGIGDVFEPGVNGPGLSGESAGDLAEELVAALDGLERDRPASVAIAAANRVAADRYDRSTFVRAVEQVLVDVSAQGRPTTSR